MAKTPAEAAKYVRTIRNSGKQAYAIAYLNFKIGKREFPQDPSGGTYNLGFIGRQAVRQRLDAIFDRAEIAATPE